MYRQIHFTSNGQIDWTERMESYLDNYNMMYSTVQ